MSTLVDIIARERIGGRVMRELSCGHRQLEKVGSRQASAARARCETCHPPISIGRPVLGACTARVFRKGAPRCGAPAQFRNVRAEPRCADHHRRAA